MKDSEKGNDPSWKNFRDYSKGKAKLKNAVLQHPEEGTKHSIYDFMQKNINRKFWISNYAKFTKDTKTNK